MYTIHKDVIMFERLTMKEILKYLRQLHSLTQEEVACHLNLSRQSYIKYEKGLVIPSSKVVTQLAQLYQVTEDFIRSNQLPKLPTDCAQTEQPFDIQKKEELYRIEPDFGQCMVADSGYGGVYSASKTELQQASRRKPKTYRGYFDGTCVRVLTDEVFQVGQEFVLAEISREDEAKRKKNALETILKYRGSLSLATDFDDKEELCTALEEKYGSFH